MKIILPAFGSLLFALLFIQCSPSQEKAEGTNNSEEEYYERGDFSTLEKYDAHVHLRKGIDSVFILQAIADNFKLLNINVYSTSGTPIEDQKAYAIELMHLMPDRLGFATTFSLKNHHQEEWVEETLAYLKKSFEEGASAVKVHKNIGMEIKDEDGNLIMVNDPMFKPIWDFLVENDIPLIGHLGEHRNSWLPLEEMTVKGNRDYARAHPQHHMYLHPDRPSYEHYIQVRDDMLENNPELIFIGAHLASLEWSVDELGKRLDKFPNMAVDMAERISHLQYQALTDWQKVRDFMIKYQDRLIYGTDLRHSAQDIVDEGIKDPEEMAQHAHRVWLRHWMFFTSDTLMNVPKVEGSFKGMKLPKTVVDKIYSGNAKKWIPKMIQKKQ